MTIDQLQLIVSALVTMCTRNICVCEPYVASLILGLLMKRRAMGWSAPADTAGAHGDCGDVGWGGVEALGGQSLSQGSPLAPQLLDTQ